MDKALVVSNYNTELDWLKETYSHGFSHENTFIYDKSDREIDFNGLGWVTKVPNYGANQYDYISFIIDHYDNLPKMSYFIKGNMFSKHENYYTTRERFAQMLDSEELFSGWQDKQLLVGNYSHTNTTPLEVLQGGRLRQPIAWCSFGGNSSMESRYYSDHTSLVNDFFVDPPDTSMIEFVPGSIMAVPKENILKYSKNLYQKLKDILSYTPEPPKNPTCTEAFVVERIFWLMWTNDLIERQ